MERLIVITTTSDSRDKLEEIAAYLVDHQLAACCQVGGPITSWYRWQGQTESSPEWICAIKTLKRLFPKVRDAIVKLHHYQQPQIVAIDIADTSQGYHQWVVESVKSE
jgi:periplasmic divalent cation tolerance protein